MRKILTWHPLGRTGAYISKKDYDVTRDFILSALSDEMTLLSNKTWRTQACSCD
jgi:hypothetical protein